MNAKINLFFNFGSIQVHTKTTTIYIFILFKVKYMQEKKKI